MLRHYTRSQIGKVQLCFYKRFLVSQIYLDLIIIFSARVNSRNCIKLCIRRHFAFEKEIAGCDPVFTLCVFLKEL
jgi:hypothetical protein